MILLPMCAVFAADDNLDPQERDAQNLFLQGEANMKVAEYESAISVFNNVVKRFPETETRYQAQFRMADALTSLKREADAVTLLQSVVKEENGEWSPKALSKIGDIFSGIQKYSDAFKAYRAIITDFPENPMVDHAYFAIGVTHFKLGHFAQASEELEKVGTAFAANKPQLQKVSPGEPLYIKMIEPNSVSTNKTSYKVYIKTTSGDAEEVMLRADAIGGDRFIASVPTVMGDAKAGDGILQLHGADKINLTYKSRYIGDAAGIVDKSNDMDIASSARMIIRNSKENEIRGIVLSDSIGIEVYDPDQDTTDAADSITVTLKTKTGDSETVTLKETGPHTGLFIEKVPTLKGPVVVDSGKIETDAALVEGSANQINDSLTITYKDEKNITVQAVLGPKDIISKIAFFAPSDGGIGAVESEVKKNDISITADLYRARSLNEMATTYRDLGQDQKSVDTFKKSMILLNNLIKKYPTAPETEDAMYSLFQSYVGLDQYDSAIGIITQMTRKYPDSPKGQQALFDLAALHLKREEYDQAMAIYQSVATRARGTVIAEQAQFEICKAYMAMYKPKTGSLSSLTGSNVKAEQISASLEEFVRSYPNSERAPDAMFQLARFRYETEDYRGVVDAGKRTQIQYPDSVITGRILLMAAQASQKLKDITGAMDILRTIIANYGSESEDAEKMLADLNRKYGNKTTTTSKEN
jgi:TolA-binding protein